MQVEKGRISNVQLTVIVMLFSVGDSILIIPSVMTAIAERSAWISALATIGAGTLICLFYAGIQRRFPGMTPVEISQAVLGRWLGGAMSFFYVFGFIFLLVPLVMRELADFMETQILPTTPVEVVYILFLFIVTYGVRAGLESLSRTAEIFAPWVIMLSFLLVVLVVPDAKLFRIEPAFYTGIPSVLGGIYPFLAYSYLQVGVLMMLFPYVKNPKNIGANLLIGTGLAGLFIAAVVYFCLTVFGPSVTADLTYPSYLLARKIEIGEFLQRIEVIMAIIWLFTLFFKLSYSLYGTCLGAAQLFGMRDMKMFVYPLAIAAVIIANRAAPNIIAFRRIANSTYPLFDFTFAILLPLMLFFVGAIRKTPGKKQSGGEMRSNKS